MFTARYGLNYKYFRLRTSKSCDISSISKTRNCFKAINNRNKCTSEANSNISFVNMQTDDTETTATRSALVPRAIFCVPVARWQQATVCVGVWAGRHDSIGLCRVTFGNQTPRIWNVTPSESLLILLSDDYHRYQSHYHRGDERGGPD